MKVAFLLNPSVRRSFAAKSLPGLIQRNVSSSKELFWVDRNISNHTEQHLEKILNGNFTHLAMASGDGTLNRVINFLARNHAMERLTCTILPYGTCNDFAKVFGFFKKKFSNNVIAAGIKAIEQNDTRTVSVWQVNDTFFINNAGFGRNKPNTKRRSSWQDLQSLKPVALEIQQSGKITKGNFLMMVAANAPFFSGGLHFSTDSYPGDDKLEFFFVGSAQKSRLAMRLLLGKLGFALQSKTDRSLITRIDATELTLQSPTPISITVDGETPTLLANIKQAQFKLAGHCKFTLPYAIK